jgi:hypothetical protein
MTLTERASDATRAPAQPINKNANRFLDGFFIDYSTLTGNEHADRGVRREFMA